MALKKPKHALIWTIRNPAGLTTWYPDVTAYGYKYLLKEGGGYYTESLKEGEPASTQKVWIVPETKTQDHNSLERILREAVAQNSGVQHVSLEADRHWSYPN